MPADGTSNGPQRDRRRDGEGPGARAVSRSMTDSDLRGGQHGNMGDHRLGDPARPPLPVVVRVQPSWFSHYGRHTMPSYVEVPPVAARKFPLMRSDPVVPTKSSVPPVTV